MGHDDGSKVLKMIPTGSCLRSLIVPLVCGLPMFNYLPLKYYAGVLGSVRLLCFLKQANSPLVLSLNRFSVPRISPSSD